MNVKIVHQGATSLVRIEGDFISETQREQLRNHITNLVKKGHTHLSIDLHKVHYINSCGIGSLVHALCTVRKAGGNLSLVGINDNVRKLLDLTRLNQIFDVITDEEAITALPESPVSSYGSQ